MSFLYYAFGFPLRYFYKKKVTMKTFISTLALVLFYSITYAQSATDDKAVRAVIQKMDDAWNAHDYSYSGQYDIYTLDATLVNPVGMYWKNRAEIIKAHQAFGETMFKYTTTKSQQVNLRFLAPTVAVATFKAQYQVEQEYKLPDGKKAGSKGDTNYAMINVVLIKQNAAWKIASQQVTELNLQVQAQDPVKRQVSR
jgi:uncharacterized protein (TIGR02246 family)